MTENPEVDPARVVEAIQAAMTALGTRALLFIALVMSFVLFCWAMYQQTPLTFSIAAVFTTIVLLPILWYSWKRETV